MPLIFRTLTFLILFNWAVGQRVQWKLVWLPWWIMSWRQTWGRCPFWGSQACQQLLIKPIMWSALAHLYFLMGTAKCHSARPSLRRNPGTSVACDRSAVGIWWALASLWLVLMESLRWWCGRGGQTLKSASDFTIQGTVAISVPWYHVTRSTSKDLHLSDSNSVCWLPASINHALQWVLR